MVADIALKTEPQAEQGLLAAVLQAPRLLPDMRRIASADDFYAPANQLIWAAICDLADAGTAPDLLRLSSELGTRGQLERIGGITTLTGLVDSHYAGAPSYAAQLVHDAARQRRAAAAATRIAQVVDQMSHDPEAMYAQLARETLGLEMLVDERGYDQPVEGLSTWTGLWQRHGNRTEPEWLVPGLLLRQDVFMLLAGEGGGKSWFTRQFVLCLMSGIHPFYPQRRLPPLRTLLVDLENPEELVAAESRTLGHIVANLGDFDDQRGHIWMREAGLNLRERSAAMLLERVIAETRPDVVALGSLYKAYRRGSDSWDQAAEDVRNVIDNLRRRYRCAFILEHHQPKGGHNGERDSTPFGSSDWMKWASLGRVIKRVGDNCYLLDSFRGDRGVRQMPLGLTRGGELPWTPIWDETELRYGMWPEQLRAREKALGAA